MCTSAENRALYDIYTQRVLGADKKELPDVLLDIDEALDIGKIDSQQASTLKNLRGILPEK